jgi:hypothetical protein
MKRLVVFVAMIFVAIHSGVASAATQTVSSFPIFGTISENADVAADANGNFAMRSLSPSSWAFGRVEWSEIPVQLPEGTSSVTLSVPVNFQQKLTGRVFTIASLFAENTSISNCAIYTQRTLRGRSGQLTLSLTLACINLSSSPVWVRMASEARTPDPPRNSSFELSGQFGPLTATY